MKYFSTLGSDVLAVVPARAGSKGIPDKNIVNFCGMPLIAHTFEAVRKASTELKPVVVTDDDRVRDLASDFGFDIDYDRPKALSGDQTSMYETLQHFFDWCGRKYPEESEFILLQPTSPLRKHLDIDSSISLYRSNSKNFLVSVCEPLQSPWEIVSVNNDNNTWEWALSPSGDRHRRQDYPSNFWFINGSIYIAKIESYLKAETLMVEGETLFYKMNQISSIDIDCELDLSIAESMYRHSFVGDQEF